MQELIKVKGKAIAKKVVQQLDMHLKNFNDDKNTQLRWIWELIQNAKDAPNKFQKVKIVQELTDQYFSSSHNGDPFKLEQLHSIVTQYSTKIEKIDEQTKTTGKYGTGFITTYALSKIVEIRGVLRVPIQETDQISKMMRQKFLEKKKISPITQKIDYIQVNSLQKENLSSANIINKNLQLNKEQQDKKQIQQNKTKNKTKHEDLNKNIYHYQQFYIQLDRQYQNRDEELLKKIQYSQAYLTKIVKCGQNQSINPYKAEASQKQEQERTINSFNTSFHYKLKKQKQFTLVENAVQNLRQLIPYALLFNDVLQEYQFIDDRQNSQHKNLSFSVIKIDSQEIDQKTNINIFTYEIRYDYNRETQQFTNKKTQHLIYSLKNQRPVAAIPVERRQNKRIILKVDQNLPQLFKDFPLIGSQPIKWNAVINSHGFYPNEKRSDLMLNSKDEMTSRQVLANKKYLDECFLAVKQIYLYLALHFSHQGQQSQNLLIMSQKNYLTTSYPQLENKLKLHICQVLQSKFIPSMKQSQKTSPRKLIFLEASVQNENYETLSQKVNKIFGFLFQDINIIRQDHYIPFFKFLKNGSQYRKCISSNGFIQFVDLPYCLKLLQKKLTTQSYLDVYKRLHYIAKNTKNQQKSKDLVQQKLHQIYAIINQCKIPYLNYKIFRNKDDKSFKNFTTDKLMFSQIPKIYEVIAGKFNIEINSFLLKPCFEKHFQKRNQQNIFNIQKFENLVYEKFKQTNFQSKDPNNKIHSFQLRKQTLKQIFKFLITFDDSNVKFYRNIKIFKDFQTIKGLKFEEQSGLQRLQPETKQNIFNLFCSIFSQFFSETIQKYPNIENFIENTIVPGKQKNKVLQTLRQLFKQDSLGKYLGLLPLKLSSCGVFVHERNLKKIANQLQNPDDEDEKIYHLLMMRPSQQKKPFKQFFVSWIYPHKYLSKVNEITYKELFDPIRINYSKLNKSQKQTFLLYINEIQNKYKSDNRSKVIIEKNQCWKKQIFENLDRIYILRSQNKEFDQQNKKGFLFNLMSDKKQLQTASQIYKRKGNKLYFDQIAAQMNNQPQKKVKID